MSRIDSFLNLSPLDMIVSRNAISISEISAVNLIVGCTFTEGPLYPFVKLSHAKRFRLFTRHESYSKLFHVRAKFETITFHVKIKMKLTN